MSTKNKMRIASIVTLLMWGFVWANVILNQAVLNGMLAFISMMAYPVVLYIQYRLYKSVDPLFLFFGDHKKFD
jgi:hypothetical protein